MSQCPLTFVLWIACKCKCLYINSSLWVLIFICPCKFAVLQYVLLETVQNNKCFSIQQFTHILLFLLPEMSFWIQSDLVSENRTYSASHLVYMGSTVKAARQQINSSSSFSSPVSHCLRSATVLLFTQMSFGRAHRPIHNRCSYTHWS